MAITLDELLGRNTREATQNNVTGFPSYEDFKSSRTNQQASYQPVQNNARYNFDMAPAREVRSTESVRNYEAARPYVAPQSSEYQTRDYPFYDNLQQRTQYAPVQYQQPVEYQAPAQTYDQVQYAQPQVQHAPVHEGFYEFTAQDTERASDQELYARLAHTNMSNAPVFDDSTAQSVQRTGLFCSQSSKNARRQRTKTTCAAQHQRKNHPRRISCGDCSRCISHHRERNKNQSRQSRNSRFGSESNSTSEYYGIF